MGQRLGKRFFEPGNDAAAKGRLFEKTVLRAIHQDNGRRLRAAAERLLDAAADGAPWAISFLALKLDGPPVPRPDQGEGSFTVSWTYAAPQAIDHVPRETVDSVSINTEQELVPHQRDPASEG